MGNAPDVVVRNIIDLQDAINSLAKQKQALHDIQMQEDISFAPEHQAPNPQSVLYQAALIIRTLLDNAEGIDIFQLNPADISMTRSSVIVYDDMYTFLYWILSPTPLHSNDDIKQDTVKESNPTLHRQILSVGQDLVYIASRGKCKTPKHVGQGVALHQMAQSKDVIQILNRNSHSISYDEVLRIDRSWAASQLLEGRSAVPANMHPGWLTRGAGDNFNRATES